MSFVIFCHEDTSFLFVNMRKLHIYRLILLSVLCLALSSCGSKSDSPKKVEDTADPKESLEKDYPEEFELGSDGHNWVDEIADWFSDNAATRMADHFTEKLSQKGKIGQELAGVRSRAHGNTARNLKAKKRAALNKCRQVEKPLLRLSDKEQFQWSTDEEAWHMADSIASVASFNTYGKMYPQGKYFYLSERKSIDKHVDDIFSKYGVGDSVSCGNPVGSAYTQFSISNGSIYTLRFYVSGTQSYSFDVKSGFKRLFSFKNGTYKIVAQPLENAAIEPELFSVRFNGDGFVLCFSPLKEISKYYVEGFFESQYNELVTGIK